jgi:hypothetical protein
MDAALAIGRIVLVIIFIASGFGKFADLSGTAAYIAGKGLPFPQLLAAAAGAGELVCGLAIAIGFQTRLAAIGLIVFTASAAFLEFACGRRAREPDDSRNEEPVHHRRVDRARGRRGRALVVRQPCALSTRHRPANTRQRFALQPVEV